MVQERYNLMRGCRFTSWEETERIPIEYRRYIFKLEEEHRKREKEAIKKAREESKRRAK
jgi:hypothetical protein